MIFLWSEEVDEEYDDVMSEDLRICFSNHISFYIYIYLYIFPDRLHFKYSYKRIIYHHLRFSFLITDYDDVGEESNKRKGLYDSIITDTALDQEIWKLNSLSNISMWNLSLNVIWNLFCNLTFLLLLLNFSCIGLWPIVIILIVKYLCI